MCWVRVRIYTHVLTYNPFYPHPCMKTPVATPCKCSACVSTRTRGKRVPMRMCMSMSMNMSICVGVCVCAVVGVGAGAGAGVGAVRFHKEIMNSKQNFKIYLRWCKNYSLLLCNFEKMWGFFGGLFETSVIR
ncbi:hypothetical protein POVWA2_024210 [Plasmodium ovale wallikeri]|uniref:Uncharacterized protein n=1 Tax=Plasmodium ovale wallikeri TaxID=864142 RepID=A0A1A8YUZ5_PLAOA|nr:hypothetical protein POVWA1_024330 [Plasmodium ovale wallikeri]SBT35267.1 hypothetical protein POVWA2_024210 [Plasmodium ovale wallikeri]